jgi:hypothetical protein
MHVEHTELLSLELETVAARAISTVLRRADAYKFEAGI